LAILKELAEQEYSEETYRVTHKIGHPGSARHQEEKLKQKDCGKKEELGNFIYLPVHNRIDSGRVG
jgi:hypothetical protein